MDGYKQGVIFRAVHPASGIVVYGQPGMAMGAQAMPLRHFVRPCSAALGACDDTLFRPASVMDETLGISPLDLIGGDRLERCSGFCYLLSE